MEQLTCGFRQTGTNRLTLSCKAYLRQALQDGIIAKAQVRGFEEKKSESWGVSKPSKGQGNIFTVPEDDE